MIDQIKKRTKDELGIEEMDSFEQLGTLVYDADGGNGWGEHECIESPRGIMN